MLEHSTPSKETSIYENELEKIKIYFIHKFINSLTFSFFLFKTSYDTYRISLLLEQGNQNPIAYINNAC